MPMSTLTPVAPSTNIGVITADVFDSTVILAFTLAIAVASSSSSSGTIGNSPSGSR